MELLIIHSRAVNNLLRPVWELLREIHVPYTDCPVDPNTVFDEAVFSGGKKGAPHKAPTHIVCIPPGEDAAEWWMYYAVGYVYGVGSGGRICFFIDPAFKDPVHQQKSGMEPGGGNDAGKGLISKLLELPGTAAAENLDELREYLEHQMEKVMTMRRKDTAKQELIESGLALSIEAFAECVRDGMVGPVKLFLKAGFSPNSTTRKGVPMLNWAIRNEQYTVFSMLLDAGADIETKSGDNGNTPLMEAVFVRDPKSINRLLELNCELNEQNKNGQTALIVAVANGYTEIAEELIWEKADISPRDNLGMTARKYAELFHHTQIMTLLDPELVS